MKIEVRFYSLLRQKLGVSSMVLELEGSLTIDELIGVISARAKINIRPELFDGNKIIPGTIILIDGYNIHHINGIETIVDKDCVVSVFPPAAGG
jgi:molybdopterin synthase sulfur carrier subunit